MKGYQICFMITALAVLIFAINNLAFNSQEWELSFLAFMQSILFASSAINEPPR